MEIILSTSKFTNLSETISIDQSDYFKLATIPEMDAVHQRSFAAVSIINHNEEFKKKVDNKHKSEIKNVVKMSGIDNSVDVYLNFSDEE